MRYRQCEGIIWIGESDKTDIGYTEASVLALFPDAALPVGGPHGGYWLRTYNVDAPGLEVLSTSFTAFPQEIANLPYDDIFAATGRFVVIQ